MPRVSLRRTCLGLAALAVLTLFMLKAHYSDQWFVVPNNQGEKVVEATGGFAPLEVIIPTEGINVEIEDNYGLVDEYSGKLWFMKDGWIRPEPSGRRTQRRPLWPHESDGDRIVNQLIFVPPDLREITKNGTKLKKILLYNGIGNWSPLKPGRKTFIKDKCPVNNCFITADRSQAESADAILFRDHFHPPSHRRKPSQVWIIYMLECPLHTQNFSHRKVFNWTATYRHDSDIVTPYEKFVPYDPNVKFLPPRRNYALNKTHKVAWFVSNCGARNGRLAYARELAEHIEVDIYGSCGTKNCPRTQSVKCWKMLDSEYKFYLAFENSNCKDYITEKFFVNGLVHDVVPIVMGARKEDYQRGAPPHSFISVEDFDSPKSLAEYLHLLDKNDTLYNEYFRWKGTGEFVNTYFWCRVCALLHDKQTYKHYENIEGWWRGQDTCISKRWNQL